MKGEQHRRACDLAERLIGQGRSDEDIRKASGLSDVQLATLRRGIEWKSGAAKSESA